MKTFKILSGVFAFAAALLMTSCLKGGESNMTSNTTFTDLFSAVIDQQSGEVTLYPNQSLKIDWKYIDGANSTANLTLGGFKIPDGATYAQLLFKDVPWTFNNRGWMDISFAAKAPDGASGYVSNLMFERFNLQSINRQWNNLTFPPCLYLAYTVGNYRIYTLQQEYIEVGETIVASPDGSTFKQNDANSAIYYFELDPVKNNAFIIIQNAKFAEKMPAMNMKFTGVNLDVNQAGIITLSAKELTPAILEGNGSGNISATDPGTPMPQFPITDLRVEINSAKGVTATYKCNAMGTLYTVNFRCNYPEAKPDMTPQN